MPESSPPEGMAEVRFLLPGLLPRVMNEIVPSVVDEVVDLVRETIPDFARPEESPYNELIRSGVEGNVVGFIDWLTDPDRPGVQERNELCRRLGGFEAMEGRPLVALESAYRLGAQVGWTRIRQLLSEYEVSADAVSALADALLTYMEAATELSREGYEEVMAEQSEARTAARLQVLHAMVDGLALDTEDMAARFGTAAWPLPDEVTLVALPTGTAAVRPLLDPDVLVEPDDPEPYLLVPGPLTEQRREMLTNALAGTRAAAGLPVAPAHAADSLSWARRLLTLVSEGVVGDGTLTLCEDHMVSVWLMADGPLMEQIARRQLDFLAHMTDRQRERLTDTLRAWLRTRGPATKISEDLGVHVQTVRYRMRRLEQVLGDELTDPDARFATEVALRALWLRSQAGKPLYEWAPDERDDADHGYVR